jgi:hypothetical protein
MWNYTKVIRVERHKKNIDGYRFITNFKGEIEHLLRKTSEIHNINFVIDNEAYTRDGRLIDFDNYKVFYVDLNIKDLSNFWNTFKQLEKEVI